MQNNQMIVIDSDRYKAVQSKNYNHLFNKISGKAYRWGRTLLEDATCAPSPEIADIEISTGNCSGQCPWCYKSNMRDNGKHMRLETFQIILEKVGRQLTQVALGITDADSNPDFPEMLKHCRKQGIIPNYTTSGLGMTDELFSLSAEVCGAVAVSVYPHNVDLAYDTVKRFIHEGIKQTNIHLLYYQENLAFVYEVLQDIARAKITPNAVVLLALKTKGRRIRFTPVTETQFSGLIDTAMAYEVPIGFDSCSAPKFERWANENNRQDLLMLSEPCEAYLFSVYCNVNGLVYPCSFAEGLDQSGTKGIEILNPSVDFLHSVWFSDTAKVWRKKLIESQRHCPIYTI